MHAETPNPTPQKKEKKSRKKGVILACSLVAVLAAGYCALCAMAGSGNIYPNVVVGEVALGGMTCEEAEAARAEAERQAEEACAVRDVSQKALLEAQQQRAEAEKRAEEAAKREAESAMRVAEAAKKAEEDAARRRKLLEDVAASLQNSGSSNMNAGAEGTIDYGYETELE